MARKKETVREKIYDVVYSNINEQNYPPRRAAALYEQLITLLEGNGVVLDKIAI